MTRNFFAATAAVALLAVPAFGFDYDEAILGDLSDDELIPTFIPFTFGSNSVTGTIGGPAATSPPDDFFDAFSFTLAAGESLTSVFVDSYVASGGNTTSGFNIYSGLNADTFIDSPLFGPADVGTDILPGALAPGDYTVGIREGTPGQAYSLSLNIGLFVPPPPPPATSVVLDPAGSVMGSLGAGEVLFYEFDFDGTTGTVDSFGTSFDTELGLYNASGVLVDSNDDTAPGLQSQIVLDGLAAGTYYLAFGGFNTTFGAADFAATSASTTNFGDFVINGIAVPEPTSLALLGMGGLAMLRRRRA